MAGKRILVVEDNPISMDLVYDLLEVSGYQADKAADGFEALKLVKKNSYDLVLMDIQLPGLDGLATTRMLKEDQETRHIPVVALTAHAMDGDDERALEAGCDGYIPKPIDTRSFVKAMAMYLK